jgi:hypothetical protein
MPPPKAVMSGTVRDLSDEDRRTLVRWIDLGCPIDFDYQPENPTRRGFGWMCDDKRPVLTLTEPRRGTNRTLDGILIGMTDYYSGLDVDSLRVTADFEIDGIAAGENLASWFKISTQGVYRLKLQKTVKKLASGTLTVSVKDRQGNLATIKRAFSVSSSD